MDTKSKHTPGPWTAERARIVGQDGDGIAHARSIANAARIVECVNACEGIDDVAAINGLIDAARLVFAAERGDESVTTGDALAALWRALAAIDGGER